MNVDEKTSENIKDFPKVFFQGSESTSSGAGEESQEALLAALTAGRKKCKYS